jgi:hypothetical protein
MNSINDAICLSTINSSGCSRSEHTSINLLTTRIWVRFRFLYLCVTFYWNAHPMMNVSAVEIPLMLKNTTRSIYEVIPQISRLHCVVQMGFATVSWISTNLILFTGQSSHQTSYNNEASKYVFWCFHSIPFSLGTVGLHSVYTQWWLETVPKIEPKEKYPYMQYYVH